MDAIIYNVIVQQVHTFRLYYLFNNLSIATCYCLKYVTAVSLSYDMIADTHCDRIVSLDTTHALVQCAFILIRVIRH